MKDIIKNIFTNIVYKFSYRNSIVQSFIGFKRKMNYEDYLTIRKNVEIHGDVSIGAFTLINRYSVITGLVRKIGRFTSIGPNVYIGPANHNYNQTSSRGLTAIADFLKIELQNDLTDRIKKEKAEVHRSTSVGHDVWLGGHSIILNGVTVGNGAVVAAHSVVTKDVPPYAIVAGVPAKIIKYRFDDETIKKLIELDFYSKPLDEIVDYIVKNPKIMIDKDAFFKEMLDGRED